MIVAGIGCRRGTSADEIVAVVRRAQEQTSERRLDALATSDRKAQEEGPPGAAARLGVPLIVLSAAALQGVADRVVTRSARVMAETGVPSVAEAAALAAAGPGARLLVARVILGGATCALAEGDVP